MTDATMTRDSSYYKKRIINYLASWGNNKYVGGVHEAPNLASADVVGCQYNGRLSEFEIKVSKSDLLGEIKAIRRALEPESITIGLWENRDYITGHDRVIVNDTKLSKTKIAKHHHYLVKPYNSFRPNQFYFAVPSSLVAVAVENLQGLKYGVMDADTLTIVKPAKSLHHDVHPTAIYTALFNRLCVMYRDSQASDLVVVQSVLNQVAKKYELEYNSVGYLRLMEIVKDWEVDVTPNQRERE